MKKIWLKALRSGKYKQGHGLLHRRESGVDRYCCLGVFAKIVGLKWDGDESTHSKTYSIFSNIDGVSTQIIPNSIASSFELRLAEQDKLSAMNDSGYSFEQIADWIEKNL